MKNLVANLEMIIHLKYYFLENSNQVLFLTYKLNFHTLFLVMLFLCLPAGDNNFNSLGMLLIEFCYW